MWLINTRTLKLQQFTTCPARNYAILSHTWEDEELNFNECKEGKGREKKGFQKIERCCEQAQDDLLPFAWVDTCCIDKSSSAELSEAINSMYLWYAQARLCYAYLADVDSEPSADHPSRGTTSQVEDRADVVSANANDEFQRQFHASRWFTRGWTLQELLAPAEVQFFNHNWLLIGSKYCLRDVIAVATGIDTAILDGSKEIHSCSIAQRMSWASHRETTRIEDITYSLLGIFDINMPLLYGEGSKAFLRLQQMIIQSSDDESIFAWIGVGPTGSGLLADSPARFYDAGSIIQIRGYWRSSFTMTNHGMAIECPLHPYDMMDVSIVQLQCGHQVRPCAIFVCETTVKGQYRRIGLDGEDLSVLPIGILPRPQFISFSRLVFPQRLGVRLPSRSGLPTLRIEFQPGALLDSATFSTALSAARLYDVCAKPARAASDGRWTGTDMLHNTVRSLRRRRALSQELLPESAEAFDQLHPCRPTSVPISDLKVGVTIVFFSTLGRRCPQMFLLAVSVDQKSRPICILATSKPEPESSFKFMQALEKVSAYWRYQVYHPETYSPLRRGSINAEHKDDDYTPVSFSPGQQRIVFIRSRSVYEFSARWLFQEDKPLSLLKRSCHLMTLRMYPEGPSQWSLCVDAYVIDRAWAQQLLQVEPRFDVEE